ncbi:MAG: hydrogenase maturation nickel metallochaperone HypA [Propionibacteriaceae bacterium]|nr:hydrogenase maturation nickel metallochaperone HypA [Propionibacteriaceae bacterium]
MHELALCRSIKKIVERAAAGRPVRVVELAVGQLRQVVPSTLEQCWKLLCDGSELQNSRLEIHPIPAVIVCNDCGTDTTLTDLPILSCGFCAGTNVQTSSGEEFMVTALQLEK